MNRNKILIPIIIFTVIIIILIIVLNPSDKYSKLSINKSKWDSIQKSRIESKNLLLEYIRFNDYKLIIDEQNNTLYYSIVNDSQNKYNPKIEYEANNKNVKIAILLDEINDEKVKNNYQFKIMLYNENEYRVYNLKCTDLPILNINYNQAEEVKQKNIPMEMYLFDNLSNIPNKIVISDGKIKINKNGYIFSLHMLTPGKNKRDNRVSILNMKPNSEYILTQTDNTTSDIIKANKENNNTEHRVELFLNNEYKGVYSLGYIENKNM